MQPNKEQLIHFNRTKCAQLVFGTLGIYSSYLIIGLIQEWLIKYPYLNYSTGEQQKFEAPANFIMFPHGMTFIIGYFYNWLSIPKQQKTVIPVKNSILCASVVLLGGVTFNYAILWTNYPIVITAKSCNLLSVILVGTLCSRVSDKKLQLQPQKIIIGIIVSIGILLFKFFDPEAKDGDEKKFQIIGLVVLLISLLADGFLPDFQAQIKSKFNPKPTQMMVQINKWVFVLCAVYVLFSGQAFTAVQFALTHQLFGIHLLGLSILSCAGHFIIYRMIKNFKQHIVPFVITTRKVFTVCISLIFYNHKTNMGQIFGIVIVLGVVIYEFLSQMVVSNKNQSQSKYSKVSEQQIEKFQNPLEQNSERNKNKN